MTYQPPLQEQDDFFLGHSAGREMFSQHWHFEMEIQYCIQGETQMEIAGQCYRAVPGDFFIIGSCIPHNYRGLTDDTLSMTIEFGSSFLGNSFYTMTRYMYPVQSRHTEIGTLLTKIFALLFRREIADRLMLKSHLFALAATILQELGTPSVSGAFPSSNFRQAEGINRVLLHVTCAYHTAISVEDAAGIAGYETKNFCRVFKIITGMSFHQYLNAYRIEQACQMFRNGCLNIGDVGKKCGIAETKTFSTLFRKHTGMTPTEFVKTFCQGMG